jgi:hypothetical protein
LQKIGKVGQAKVGTMPLGFAAFVTTVFFTVSFIGAAPE